MFLKTEYMKLLNIGHNSTVHLNGTNVKKVTSSKTLGVIIDECMTWQNQIGSIAKKGVKWNRNHATC